MHRRHARLTLPDPETSHFTEKMRFRKKPAETLGFNLSETLAQPSQNR
jgi:hypothetical protein